MTTDSQRFRYILDEGIVRNISKMANLTLLDSMELFYESKEYEQLNNNHEYGIAREGSIAIAYQVVVGAGISVDF